MPSHLWSLPAMSGFRTPFLSSHDVPFPITAPLSLVIPCTCLFPPREQRMCLPSLPMYPPSAWQRTGSSLDASFNSCLFKHPSKILWITLEITWDFFVRRRVVWKRLPWWERWGHCLWLPASWAPQLKGTGFFPEIPCSPHVRREWCNDRKWRVILPKETREWKKQMEQPLFKQHHYVTQNSTISGPFHQKNQLCVHPYFTYAFLSSEVGFST